MTGQSDNGFPLNSEHLLNYMDVEEANPDLTGDHPNQSALCLVVGAPAVLLPDARNQSSLDNGVGAEGNFRTVEEMEEMEVDSHACVGSETSDIEYVTSIVQNEENVNFVVARDFTTTDGEEFVRLYTLGEGNCLPLSINFLLSSNPEM